MDNLTHTLVGVTLANAGLKQRYGRGTTLALVVASNIPDLDVFGGFFHPGPSFLYRRMFTHSLLALPVLSAGCAALYRFACPNLKFSSLWFLWALGISLHVVFDLINSFGVVLLYPVIRHRFELSSVFIIDLALWGLMLSPLLIWRCNPSKFDLKRLSRIAANAVVIYLIACIGLRWRSNAALNLYEIEQGINPSLSYVFPEPFGPQRFRGVVRQDDIYRIYRINSLTGVVSKFDELKTQDELPGARTIAASEAGRGMLWFAKAPVLRKVGESPGGAERWLLYDLRFGSTVLARRKNFFRYGFEVEGDAVRSLGRVSGDGDE